MKKQGCISPHNSPPIFRVITENCILRPTTHTPFLGYFVSPLSLICKPTLSAQLSAHPLTFAPSKSFCWRQQNDTPTQKQSRQKAIITTFWRLFYALMLQFLHCALKPTENARKSLLSSIVTSLNSPDKHTHLRLYTTKGAATQPLLILTRQISPFLALLASFFTSSAPLCHLM